MDNRAVPVVVHKKVLDTVYTRYNRREYVHPDPLEVLYEYDDLADREIVGLIASSLAYGRVRQILKSVSAALARMDVPSTFLRAATRTSLREHFADFKHRFTTGEDMAGLLFAAKTVIERHGSLRACFANNINRTDETVLPALTAFVQELNRSGADTEHSLLPQPERGSSCKRLNLYLRWMVRRDEVDPGGWDEVPAAKLVVPLDTHMHRIGRTLGLTRRKQADMRTALEITDAFRTVAPHDPVRYDFALTRLGMCGHKDVVGLLRESIIERR